MRIQQGSRSLRHYCMRRRLSVMSLQGVDVDPQHLTVLSGAGSVLDLLLHCIADRGDAVLIPAPYYPAFDNDLKVCGTAAGWGHADLGSVWPVKGPCRLSTGW